MQRTGAVCQKAAAPLKAIGVTVSEESIRAYLEDLNHRGRREETVRFYAAKLKTFYDSTPILKWETRQWGEIPADFGRK